MDWSELSGTMRRDGCALAKGVFDRSAVDALEADFDAIVAQLVASGEDLNARWASASRYADAADRSVVHTHHVQNYSAAWLHALLDERFLDATEALLGPDIVLHHTKLFEKPPVEGAPFPMHQDWRYFPTEQDSMIAAIIHLTPATKDMGCLQVYPGSHRLGRLDSTSGRLDWDDADRYRDFASRHPAVGATPYEAEPGDVLFLSYFAVHGSGPNRTERTRKTVLVQLMSGDDRLEEGNDHAFSGLVLRGRNHRASRRSVNHRRPAR